MTAEERIGILREYGARLGLRTFVETGTADGATTLALKDDFDRLVTVELDHERYLYVTLSRFLPHPQILPIWGDSGKVLGEIAHWIGEPALFWLDAHYCGGTRGDVDTPIENELHAIAELASPGSMILIDDARLFGVDPAYPSLEWVDRWCTRNGYRLSRNDDVLELHRQ